MNHGIIDDEHAIDQWLNSKRSAGTREQYNLTIGALRRANMTPLNEITVHDLQMWMASISHKSVASIRRETSAVKSLFTYLCRVGYLKENVSVILNPPRAEDKLAERFLTEAEVEKMIQAAEGNLRNYVLIRFLYLTGARASEVARVKWEDFQTPENPDDGAKVRLFGKGGKKRYALTGAALWIDLCELRKQKEGKSKDLVFGFETHREVLRAVKSVARVAGLSHVTPHFFRHSVATHALQNGMPLQQVSIRLGHEDWKTTQKYLHLKEKESFNQFVKVG